MNEPSKSAQAVEPLAWQVVALVGILNLFRGSIHTFLPDGGAGVIAGFDLSHSRQTIVFLFAVMGIEQLSLGVVDLIVAFRARWLALPMLWFHTLEQTAAEIVFVLYKPAPGRPPGIVGLPLMVLLLWLVLGWIYWPRSSGARETAHALIRATGMGGGAGAGRDRSAASEVVVAVTARRADLYRPSALVSGPS